LTKNQTTRNQIKDLLLETVKKQKPETAKQLIKLVQQSHAFSEEELTNILIELENENKMHLTKKETPIPASMKAYVFSSRSAWYWTTIVLAIVTTTTVFTIPEDAYPIVYVRSALGVMLVLWLPGYTFIKALFPTSVPIKTSSENIDTIERVALSLGMSLALTPIVGLILNYTPWGIRLTPVTLSLLALTVVFATAAILREYQTKTKQTK
jgi:hypothetical protein